MISADLPWIVRFSHPHVGVADNGQVFAVRFERQECAGAQVEALTDILRCPQVSSGAPWAAPGRAVHRFDGNQTNGVVRQPGTASWHHRIQERKCDCRPCAAQERAAWNMPAGYECHGSSLLCATAGRLALLSHRPAAYGRPGCSRSRGHRWRSGDPGFRRHARWPESWACRTVRSAVPARRPSGSS